MDDKQTLMRSRPVFPLLLSMALPMMTSMLIQSLYNIVDSIWVTRLGTDALTAVSLAYPLQNAVLSVGVGMGIGMSALVSLHLGAGEREKADVTASTGMALMLLHCVLFFLAGVFVTRPFLRLFAPDPHTLRLACDYTRIVLCFSFGQLLQMGYEKIMQGMGRMTTSMLLMASGCVINIVLDPILIFGWFGLPAMGVRGAAWATVIGQVAGLLLYMLVFARMKGGVRVSPRRVRFRPSLVGKLYGVGLPSTLMLAMPSLLTGLLNGLLAGLGGIYVAVFGLYVKLQTFINMPSGGVVMGMRPVIGYNYGAGLRRRVRQTIGCAVGVTAAIMALGTVCATVFPEQILRIFDADPALLREGAAALRIIGWSFLPSTLSVVACGVFEALGRGRQSLVISLLRQLVVPVAAGWLLSRSLGAAGVWLAFPAAELAALCLSALLLHRLIRQELREESAS